MFIMNTMEASHCIIYYGLVSQTITLLNIIISIIIIIMILIQKFIVG